MAIKFDYQQTIQQAQALEQLAQDLNGKTKSKLTGVKENLSAAWTGDSGKSFIKFLTDAESPVQAADRLSFTPMSLDFVFPFRS